MCLSTASQPYCLGWCSGRCGHTVHHCRIWTNHDHDLCAFKGRSCRGFCSCTAVGTPRFSQSVAKIQVVFLIGHSYLDSSHKGPDINRLSEEVIYLDSWH